jgi:murein DD-endopeptidase MepM/ murein hydrolase activator NlpD
MKPAQPRLTLTGAFAVLLILVPCAGALGDSQTVAPVIEVAAFGVQPVRAEASPATSRAYPGYAARPRSTRVFHDDSWTRVLERLQIVPPHLSGTAGLTGLPELLPAKFVRLRDEPDQAQPSVDYVVSAQEAYQIRLLRDGAEVRRGPPAADLLRAMREDEAKASLFAATDAAGLPEAIALQLAEIFADAVDFHRDLAGGYRCALVFEMYYPDGLPTPGLILAAEFISPDKRLLAFFHDDGNGEAGYFGLDGTDVNGTLRPVDPGQAGADRTTPDLARTFRRSPLEFSRITSAPATLRYHPILKEWRAHRGTDYGAPIGTKVLATGPGEVQFLGEKGGFGKLVVLRHYDRFTTYYGHLSGYAAGLRQGGLVRKGEVIGYVGMTGLATGPHLHYEFHADPGAAPRPVALAVRRVPDGQLAAFLTRSEDYRAKLGFAQAVNLVLLE